MTENGLNWTRLSTSIAYSSSEFDVRQDVVTDSRTELCVSYLDAADAVTVVAFTQDDNILVVDEWRHSVNRIDRGLPSGQLEPDETDPAEAARRELREETGYKAGELEAIGTFEPLNSLVDAVIHYFIATDCRATGDRNPDADERIRVLTKSMDELRTMIETGELTDMKTAFGILYVSSSLESNTQPAEGA